MSQHPSDYHIRITAEPDPLRFSLRELWSYRDLVVLYTKRTFKLIYKQTVLGPAWILLRMLMTSTVYTALFGRLAGLSTGGVPQFLFYLCSQTLWLFFSDCLNKNSSTFLTNERIYGKVYFPRLTIPLSTVLSALIQFALQMCLTVVLIVWYVIKGDLHPNANLLILVVPVVLSVGMMGLGLGILISGVTTKYRDLAFLVDFGLRLWMYASPVVYPLSQLSGPACLIMQFNPLTAPMELFRLALLGTGQVTPVSVLSTLLFTAASLIAGVRVFTRVERSFIDSI